MSTNDLSTALGLHELPPDAIDAAALEALVARGAAEGRQLEFKRDLPGGGDKEVLEYLTDVAAFANAVGGAIVYGLAEGDRGVAGELVGLPGLDETVVLRLEQLARDCIDPRIPDLRFFTVTRGDRPALVVRIGQSWIRPHQVKRNGVTRFPRRGEAGKHELDVRQIGELFVAGRDLGERIKRWRAERVASVAADQLVPRLDSELPRIILHAVPLAPVASVNVKALGAVGRELHPFGHSNQNSLHHRYNVDGLVVTSGSRQSPRAFLQVFREGAVEMAATLRPFKAEEKLLRPQWMASVLYHGLRRFGPVFRRIHPSGPYALLLSLVSTRGWRLTDEWNLPEDWPGTDRSDLLFPDCVVDGDALSDATVHDLLDVVWQSFGVAACPYYADETWIGDEVTH